MCTNHKRKGRFKQRFHSEKYLLAPSFEPVTFQQTVSHLKAIVGVSGKGLVVVVRFSSGCGRSFVLDPGAELVVEPLLLQHGSPVRVLAIK